MRVGQARGFVGGWVGWVAVSPVQGVDWMGEGRGGGGGCQAGGLGGGGLGGVGTAARSVPRCREGSGGGQQGEGEAAALHRCCPAAVPPPTTNQRAVVGGSRQPVEAASSAESSPTCSGPTKMSKEPSARVVALREVSTCKGLGFMARGLGSRGFEEVSTCRALAAAAGAQRARMLHEHQLGWWLLQGCRGTQPAALHQWPLRQSGQRC